MRLMEVLLHGGGQLAGRRRAQIHQSILAAFGLTARQYTLTQLRYDLRKTKGHGPLERDGQRDCSRSESCMALQIPAASATWIETA